MGLLYLLIGLIATTVGALSGLGGGVIIKPVLDIFGHYDIATIGILSSATVFSMSIVALLKKFIAKATFEYTKLLAISLGAILGGIVGKYAFTLFTASVEIDLAKIIQSVCLALLMVAVLLFSLYRNKIKTYKTNNIFICLSAGLFMGFIAAFLGIGGGPINVAIIIILFSCNAKDAAIYSIFTIFFSQLSTLATTFFTTGFQDYNLEVIGYMIIGGISGGFIGDKINKKISVCTVEKLFNIAMVVVILLNIYNIIKVIL
ncbi:MAG: hypothetical protein BEN19_02125 [Epulopiscium sp. Nuni2H_MBin003]|nr:MAG: hypothetical protein BEN19_02125 [Epulopiscium sp. Nuni2H_MBin003]